MPGHATRSRLVCQEPGLRPIGRNLGVPDKSSRCLGNMSWYSVLLVYSIHFPFLFPCGFGWELCRTATMYTVPSANVHCNQNEAGHQAIKAPSMPCWRAAGPWKHSLAFMPQDWWHWQINGWNMYQWGLISTSSKWMGSFLRTCE